MIPITLLKDWTFSLSVDDVLRGQGAEPAVVRARRPVLIEMAAWALREGTPLLEAVVLARELTVKEMRHERLLLEGGGVLSGSLIGQHLSGANQVVALLCTIGPRLESVSAELMTTDPLYALALEGLGTAAVESLANQAVVHFEKQAHAAGLHTSIPLSPGMVGWPVDPGQRQIFSLVNGGMAGISLNDNAMMTPRMSLSQILGFGEQMAFQGRTCDFCGLQETCRYRG